MSAIGQLAGGVAQDQRPLGGIGIRAAHDREERSQPDLENLK